MKLFTIFLVQLFLIVVLTSCTSSNKEKSGGAQDKILKILKERNIAIYEGSKLVGATKTKQVGDVVIYKVEKSEGLYKKLVDYYHKQTKEAKLFGGLPFSKEITVNDKRLKFTGAGGQDFTNKVVVYVSKIENNLDHIKVLVEAE